MDKLNAVQQVCVWALPILFAVTMHEAAHGWVAYKFGDDTAYAAGRITANPLKHIDLIGTIIVPILLLLTTSFIFGWAKPVPVNEARLRKPKRDIALVAFAGPGANLIMAFMWAFFLKMGIYLVHQKIQMGLPLILMSEAGISINLFLMVLNLIPIPPLDGSRIVSSLLPLKISKLYDKMAAFGFAILLILLITNIIPQIVTPPIEWMSHALLRIFHIS